jgi:hypothetical protein
MILTNNDFLICILLVFFFFLEAKGGFVSTTHYSSHHLGYMVADLMSDEPTTYIIELKRKLHLVVWRSIFNP